MAASVGDRPEGERRTGPRGRRKVDTGFRSLRELMAFGLGGWTFWFLTTRVAHPDMFALGASVMLMAAPTLTAVYRAVNALLGAGSRVVRELGREEQE